MDFVYTMRVPRQENMRRLPVFFHNRQSFHFSDLQGDIVSKCGTRLNMAHIVFYAVSLIAAGWAYADVVVVAGANSPAGALTKDQSADIFLGKATSLTPLDQPESSPLREEFYSRVTGKSAAQAKSHWSKLSFTGKGTPPKEGQNSADIKKRVAENPKLIGYIEKSAVDSSVKVIFDAQ
jgi:hypothetical protein